jgi:hypothetical protein
MRNIVFVLSIVIPVGLTSLLVGDTFFRRHIIVRWLTLVPISFLALMVWTVIVPINLGNIDLIFLGVDGNRWIYSELPGPGRPCEFDAVTCAYIKPTPPTGLHDEDTPGSAIWVDLAIPLFAIIYCGVVILRAPSSPAAMRADRPIKNSP